MIMNIRCKNECGALVFFAVIYSSFIYYFINQRHLTRFVSFHLQPDWSIQASHYLPITLNAIVLEFFFLDSVCDAEIANLNGTISITVNLESIESNRLGRREEGEI